MQCWADVDDLAELNNINICGRLMVLQRCHWWTIPNNFQFQLAHLWIRIEGLPVGLLKDEIAHILLGSVGEVTEVMAQDPLFDLATSIRARVWVDLSLPLIPGCFVPTHGNRVAWVTFKYEKVMRFCKRCGKVGHTTNTCKIPVYLATRGILRRFQPFQDAGVRILQGPDDTAMYSNRIRGLIPTPIHWNTRIYLGVAEDFPVVDMQVHEFTFNPSDEDSNSDEDLPQFNHENLTGKGKAPVTDDMTGSTFSLSNSPSGSPCSPLFSIPQPHEPGPSNRFEGSLSVGHSDSQPSKDTSDFQNVSDSNSPAPSVTRNTGVQIGKRKAQSSDSAIPVRKKLQKCVTNSDDSVFLKTLSFNKLKRKLGEGFMSVFNDNSVMGNGSMGSHQHTPHSGSSGNKWLIIDSECISSTKRAKISPGPVLVVKVSGSPVQSGSCSESKDQMESMTSSDEVNSADFAGDPDSASDPSSDHGSDTKGEVASLNGPLNSP